MGIIRKAYDKGEKIINDIKKKTQNPLKEFEKELNNLREYIKETESLAAHFTALRLRAEKDIDEYNKQSEKYLKKAEDALKSASEGKITEKKAETVSLNALKFKKLYEKRAEELKNKIPEYDKEIEKLKEKITDLRLKREHYEQEYEFLKSNTGNPVKEKISDFFYGDENIYARLEKLKNKLLKQNEKTDFLIENSDSVYEEISDEDIAEEYENLKSEFKK